MFGQPMYNSAFFSDPGVDHARQESREQKAKTCQSRQGPSVLPKAGHPQENFRKKTQSEQDKEKALDQESVEEKGGRAP
jgi:hypothetical protein